MFVAYPPYETVSETLTYTFSFPNYFDITVRNGMPGSQNLGMIGHGIFDGERVLRITHP